MGKLETEKATPAIEQALALGEVLTDASCAIDFAESLLSESEEKQQQLAEEFQDWIQSQRRVVLDNCTEERKGQPLNEKTGWRDESDFARLGIRLHQRISPSHTNIVYFHRYHGPDGLSLFKVEEKVEGKVVRTLDLHFMPHANKFGFSLTKMGKQGEEVKKFTSQLTPPPPRHKE